MTDVEHLFMCLLAICMFSLGEISVYVFFPIFDSVGKFWSQKVWVLQLVFLYQYCFVILLFHMKYPYALFEPIYYII